MDTSDPLIQFDENGNCNHCNDLIEKYKQVPRIPFANSEVFAATVREIKDSSKGKKYDCILGLSGGVDSSYLAYLLKYAGLNPLVVHFDNGWNSELAVKNIENIVNKLGFELYTYVIDWNEFKELQLSYFRASVIDLEVPTDHLIFGALYTIAKKYGIKNIISGFNLASEGIMPLSWLYMRKFDRANMKDIHKKFGTGKMSKLPTLGFWARFFYNKIYRFREYHLLQTFEYNKFEAKEILKNEFGWADYGGKHYESVFTRFYQGYFLPIKFGIDKRRAHLSNLIASGQMKREDAVEELKKPTYDTQLQIANVEYVCKKWQISKHDFEKVMNSPQKSHDEFANEIKLETMLNSIIGKLKFLIKIKAR